jgi:hypothetical protein
VACAVGGVQDLVVEDGEVEGKTEADGVGRGELSLGDVGSALRRLVSIGSRQRHDRMSRYLVGIVGSSGGSLALVTGGELGKVTVVVTLPGRLSEIDF